MSRIKEQIKNRIKKSDRCKTSSNDKYKFILIDSNSAYVEKNIGD